MVAWDRQESLPVRIISAANRWSAIRVNPEFVSLREGNRVFILSNCLDLTNALRDAFQLCFTQPLPFFGLTRHDESRTAQVGQARACIVVLIPAPHESVDCSSDE